MTSSEKDQFVLIRDEGGKVEKFANLLAAEVERFQDNNLVVDLLVQEDLSLEHLLLFLEISNAHRSRKKSFVLVNNSLEVDVIPEELVVVPTVAEASDIVEMEEIERDLGF